MEKIEIEQQKICVLAFYCFTNVQDPDKIKPIIKSFALEKNILGTIIIAKEGFNGSISGPQEILNETIEKLKTLTKMQQSARLSQKLNFCNHQPFKRLRVKSKSEIVTLRSGEIDVENLKGKYIKPENWSNFINRKDVITIDTRNDYEIALGSFKGAINPKTECFAEFPKFCEKNKAIFEGKKVAMFCTGGIRCEKSTAFLRSKGVEEVFHLDGGILQYFKDTKNESGSWTGDCFVFDGRETVTDQLVPKKIDESYQNCKYYGQGKGKEVNGGGKKDKGKKGNKGKKKNENKEKNSHVGNKIIEEDKDNKIIKENKENKTTEENKENKTAEEDKENKTTDEDKENELIQNDGENEIIQNDGEIGDINIDEKKDN